MPPVRTLIVMGVSGSGKSSFGGLLATRLRGAYLEGDDYHPATNVAKMASGTPLDDTDRWPWLELLAEAIGRAREKGLVVASCSALKRSYRDRLRSVLEAPVCFLCLNPQRVVLERRLRARPGHFMPSSLLDSQLHTLELPRSDEAALIFTADEPLAALVEAAIARLPNCDASRQHSVSG